MRIIDADKLINEVEQHCIDDEITCRDDVIEIIEAAPTIEERRPGKWRARNNKYYAGDGYYFCNKCSQRYSFGGYFELDNENFCPNCGAKMKGAKE